MQSHILANKNGAAHSALPILESGILRRAPIDPSVDVSLPSEPRLDNHPCNRSVSLALSTEAEIPLHRSEHTSPESRVSLDNRCASVLAKAHHQTAVSVSRVLS